MFIPANFAIGALVGAAASYVYKDEAAKETLSNLGNKVKGGLDSTLGLFKKKSEVDAEAEIVADVVAEKAEAVVEEKSDKV